MSVVVILLDFIAIVKLMWVLWLYFGLNDFRICCR